MIFVSENKIEEEEVTKEEEEEEGCGGKEAYLEYKLYQLLKLLVLIREFLV